MATSNSSLKDTEYRVTLKKLDDKIKEAWKRGYMVDVDELLEERYIVTQDRNLEKALVGG